MAHGVLFVADLPAVGWHNHVGSWTRLNGLLGPVGPRVLVEGSDSRRFSLDTMACSDIA
jgi:hypothetical protein